MHQVPGEQVIETYGTNQTICSGTSAKAVCRRSSGKTIGIQGFGNIGQLVAKKAVGLGMNVIVLAPQPAEKHQGWNTVATIEELYSKSNFVSVNIPATPETKGMIGYDLLTKMPKGGCLINTARKEVVCEEGLDQALSERPDIKYVTDVAAVHQADLDAKFPKQVFATPKKMGAETAEANVNAGLAAARQICDFFATGCTRFQLNK